MASSCRKCSHCGGNGHNSRTCAERGGVKLFGVRIGASMMRKSASTGNLVDSPSPSPRAAARQDGYASEDLLHASHQRKKGVPWSEEEHKLFLIALHKLGKGDWRGISKQFVKTRTPTQVASHAQKYFLRQSNISKRRRRSSLFDMAPDVVAVDAVQETLQESNTSPCEPDAIKTTRSTREVSLADDTDIPSHFMKTHGNHEANHNLIRKHGMPPNESRQSSYTSAYMHFPGWKHPYSLDPALFFYYTWPRLQGFPNLVQSPNSESKIVRPIPLAPTSRVKIDALSKSSELNNVTACPVIGHTSLSPGLSINESRQSAFHTLTAAGDQHVNIQSRLCSNVISVA